MYFGFWSETHTQNLLFRFKKEKDTVLRFCAVSGEAD